MCGVVLAIVCECLLFLRLFWVCVTDRSASLLLCSFTSEQIGGTKSAAWDIRYSYINIYLWTRSKTVSSSVFLVSEFWHSGRMDPFTFVDLNSCAYTTLKKILMTAHPLGCQHAPQREPLLISVFLSRSFWGIIEPEPHQLKTRTVPLVLYVDNPPDWPQVTKRWFSIPPRNSFNATLSICHRVITLPQIRSRELFQCQYQTMIFVI